MNSDVLFERDMLYPTDSSFEPGCIHIQVFGPDANNKLPVVIEEKTGHSPLKYIDSIVRLMQSDIFDRVFINIKKNVEIYIKVNTGLSNEFGGYNHVKISFADGEISSEGINI